MSHFFLFVREYRGIQIRFWWLPTVARFKFSWERDSQWDYSFANDLAEIRADAVLSVDRMLDRDQARRKARR